MEQLTKALSTPKTARAQTWQTWVESVIRAAAKYYNAHPAASILLLRGAFSDGDRDAHAVKNMEIGGLLRAKAESLSQLRTLPTAPDVAMIAVELAFACMKYGYAQEGKVSPAICDEATRAVTAYLAQWGERRDYRLTVFGDFHVVIWTSRARLHRLNAT